MNSDEKNKGGLLPEDGVSEKIASMTREEALAYLDLPADADKDAIENKFWQLSKNLRTMRGDEAEQKLADLSAAYDIATGNRDMREKAAEARAKEKKFLGKTKAEWKNYVSYTWKYYVGALIVIIVSASLLYNFLFKPREDCGIISIGNFECSGEYYGGVLKDMGFKHPNITTYDYVAISEGEQTSDQYNNQAAVASVYSGANVIVTDSSALPYFFEYLTDCTELYKALEERLPAEIYSKVKPVYMSEREYKAMIVEYRKTKGMELADTDVDLSTFSDAKIMTGLMIDDPDLIKKLGYTNYWRNKPATAVFSISVLSRDQDDSAAIITAVLKSL